MKKSTRILAVIMALTMLVSIFSVVGSAYQGYKGESILTTNGGLGYNDVDKPQFTTEQYASMVLDYLDKMLLDADLYLTEDDIFVATLDLRSVNTAFADVASILESAGGLLGMLGSAKDLNVNDFRDSSGKVYQRQVGTKAENGVTCSDFDMFKKLVAFLNTNVQNGLVPSFVEGSFSLGILNSVIPEINVTKLLQGLLIDIMDGYDNTGLEFDWEGTVLPAKYATQTDGYADTEVILNDLLLWAMVGNYEPGGTDNCGYRIKEGGHEGLIWEYLNDLTREQFNDVINNTLNIVNTDDSAYEFIEKLLEDAYNYVAVPELTYVTIPWLREECGIKYDTSKMDSKTGRYPADYVGEPYTDADLTVLADLFDYNDLAVPEFVVPHAGDTVRGLTVTEDATFITYLNDYLYEFLNENLATEENEPYSLGDITVSWSWDLSEDIYKDGKWHSTNDKLFQNIGNVAKYVLAITGDLFFADYIKMPSAEEIMGFSDQEIYAFVIRAILNASVDALYIPDDCDTVAKALYEGVRQLAWQDIPQFSYTPASDSNDDLLDSALDIFMDIAVFNLNQSDDLNPATRASGVTPDQETNNGLLEYEHDWKSLATQVAVWAVSKYGKMVTANGCSLEDMTLGDNNGQVGNLTIQNLWDDLDILVNSLFPISNALSGQNVWLNAELAAKDDVVKSIVFDTLVGSILDLDAGEFVKLFIKNENGTFATKTVVDVLLELVGNVLNTVFSATIINAEDIKDFDQFLNNANLAGVVKSLFGALNSHIDQWLEVGLFIAADILELTDAQEFGEMEIYLPESINASDATANQVKFQIFNGCTGINTGYTSSNGQFYQDGLYSYEITESSVTCGSNTITATGISPNSKLNGGDSANITLSGTFTAGNLLEFSVSYKVLGETGQPMQATVNGKTDDIVLTSTAYAYVGSTDTTDNEAKAAIGSLSSALPEVQANRAVYLNTGSGLGSADDLSVNVRRAANSTGAITVTASKVGTANPWLIVDPEASLAIAENTSDKQTNNIFEPLTTADGYVRNTTTYNKVNTNAEKFAARTEPYYTYVSAGVYQVANTYDPEQTYYTKAETQAVVYNYADVNVSNFASGTYYVKNDNGTYTRATSFNADTTYYTQVTRTLVNDGRYDFTFKVSDGTNSSPNIPFTVYLYNDYGLGSLYSSTVKANRQFNDYAVTKTGQTQTSLNNAWSAYKTALGNAGSLVLAPKNVGSFDNLLVATDSTYTSKGLNRFAQYYDALANAIKALDAYKVAAGVDQLKADVENWSGRISNSYYLTEADEPLLNAEKLGWNNIPYYVTAANSDYRYGYEYFGYRDYVPHFYQSYRSAKNEATSLIDSQIVYPPIEPDPLPEGANSYETSKYNEAMAAYEAECAIYEEKLAAVESNPLNPVDVAYADHMVNLWGDRLIRLPGYKSKLEDYINVVRADETIISNNQIIADASATYTPESLTDFTNAYNFAVATVNAFNGEDSSMTIKPSRVNEAISNLIESYKKLVMGENLDALVEILAEYDLKDPDGYTAESWAVYEAACNSGRNMVAEGVGVSSTSAQEVADMVARIQKAADALVAAGASGATWEITTEDPGCFYEWINYVDTFTPSVVTEDFNLFAMEMYEIPSDVSYLTGLSISATEDLAEKIFSKLEGCTINFIPAIEGYIGTGAKIQIIDSKTNEVLHTYICVVFGDIDGDAFCTSTDYDLTYIDNGADGIYLYEFETAHMAYAGDIDNNGSYDSSDYDLLVALSGDQLSIDQNTVYGEERVYLPEAYPVS